MPTKDVIDSYPDSSSISIPKGDRRDNTDSSSDCEEILFSISSIRLRSPSSVSTLSSSPSSIDFLTVASEAALLGPEGST